MAAKHKFECSAVENTILNFLVASEKNYEYPSLQKEAVDVISNNIAKIVYETLKQKSIASSTKRCNILTFINNICQSGEYHLDTNTYKIYLDAYEKEFCKIDNPEIENLLQDINLEINKFNTDLKCYVADFYKRKNVKRKERAKKIEVIKQKDQEKLNIFLGIQIPKNVSHYETSECLINELLKMDCTENNKNVINVNINQNSIQYREKQIKFCYALVNIGDKNDVQILENVLRKLSRCKNLERFEIGFLMDLWLMNEGTHLDINNIIIEHFPFVVEKVIIQFCTEIVKLKDASQVSRYFTDLESNPKVMKVRNVCQQHPSFYCKMKSLIFELYVFSYCNTNVYRFIDYII